jgi:hypothetical protein
MLPGDPTLLRIQFGSTKIIDVTSDIEGVFYPLVKRGTYVAANAKLGYVTDYFGKIILEPRAPESRVVLHVNAVPSLKKGDNIANIGAMSPPALRKEVAVGQTAPALAEYRQVAPLEGPGLLARNLMYPNNRY